MSRECKEESFIGPRLPAPRPDSVDHSGPPGGLHLNIAGQAITLFYHITQRTRADMPQTFGVNAAVVDASEAYVRNFISQRSSEACRLLFPKSGQYWLVSRHNRPTHDQSACVLAS
jgi:hypothetical protein